MEMNTRTTTNPKTTTTSFLEKAPTYSYRNINYNKNLDDCSNSYDAGETNTNSAIATININEDARELTTFEQLLFFASGIGSSLGHISTLSSLVYFEYYYGANSYIFLNLMVYLPLVPISVLQARYDRFFDSQEGSVRTYFFRGCVGFALTLWGSIQMACIVWCRWRSNKERKLGVFLWCTFLQGTGGAILYGTFNQMASFTSYGRPGESKMKAETSRLKATISSGVQASALITLVVSLATGFANISENMTEMLNDSIIYNDAVVYDRVNGYDDFFHNVTSREDIYEYVFSSDDGAQNHERFFSFLITIIILLFLSVISFLWLLFTRPLIHISMSRRDVLIRQTVFIDLNEISTFEEPLLPLSFQRNLELSYRDLWTYSCSTCGVLFLSLIPSFLIASWLTQVKTCWIGLSQVLFYTRIISDFAGRVVTVWFTPKDTKQLAWLATLRLIPVVLFFRNAGANGQSFIADLLSIVLVAVVAFLSGYIVTGCYQVAPNNLPCYKDGGENSVTKQTTLLTVTVGLAAWGGILLSFVAVRLL